MQTIRRMVRQAHHEGVILSLSHEGLILSLSKDES